MVFVGGYSAKLDDKGRLVLPALFRQQIKTDDDNMFICRINFMVNCIDIIPQCVWMKEVEEFEKKVDVSDEEGYKLWLENFGDIMHVSIDMKTGRLTVPKEMLENAGIEKEAFFLGTAKSVQLWNKSVYDEGRMNRNQFKDKRKEVMRRNDD